MIKITLTSFHISILFRNVIVIKVFHSVNTPRVILHSGYTFVHTQEVQHSICVQKTEGRKLKCEEKFFSFK